MPPAKKPRAPKAEPPPQPPPRRGRPDRGVRRTYQRVEVAFPPDVYEAVARLADRRQVESGKTVRRADIIRLAVLEHLRQHLPEAGL